MGGDCGIPDNAGMSERLHLIVDGAGFAGCGTRLADVPALAGLLSGLQAGPVITVDDTGPDTPCERALAQARGLPGGPGRLPWAALDSGTTGAPCAFLHLCHWEVGMDQVQVLDPGALALTDEETEALRGLLAPWLEQDGIALRPWRTGIWLAQGEPLRDLACVSLDRVVGRRVSRDLLQAQGTAAPALTRLLAEVQMLLYQHPVTDARLAQRRLAPNALWITGAGALDALPAPASGLLTDTHLADAARHGGPAAHAQAWRALAGGATPSSARPAWSAWLQARAAGQPVTLTLCGPRQARSLISGPPAGWMTRLARGLRASRPDFELDQL